MTNIRLSYRIRALLGPKVSPTLWDTCDVTRLPSLTLFLCAAVGANSSRPGTVALVPARRTAGRGGHLLHVHPAAAVGGSARGVGLHCWPLRSTRLR